MRKALSGLTIVELLIVITIIGILATIGIVSYSSINTNSADSRRKLQTEAIADELEKYYNQNGGYPSCADLTQSPDLVVKNVLPNLSPGTLTAPGEPEGTNSIVCTATPTTNQYGYTTDGGSFSLNYIGTSGSTTVSSVTSRHDYKKLDFAYTGSYQSYTIPQGVYSIKVEAWGAQGGGETGGKGGYATGDIPVTPGEVLRVYVGGRGATGTCVYTSNCMTGGFNGGGNGGGSDVSSTGHGGGGATDVRRSPYDLASRIIVAGGGGARGGERSTGVGAGGDGGGLTGGNGYVCTNCSGSPVGGPGSGGTQASGGSGGIAGAYSVSYPGLAGGAGSLGQGGNSPSCWYSGSGGGGGGYYGGGGGGCPGQHGGGGGSSWIISTADNVNHSSGLKIGNGQATIYVGS